MAEPEEILGVLAVLAAGHPHTDIPDATQAVYCELLSDIKEPLLMEAAKRCLKTCTFFPKIAELRNAASAIAKEQRDANALQRLRDGSEEMLPKSEAARFMRILKEKAIEAGNNAALIPFKRQLERARLVSDFVVGDMNDEDWKKHKDKIKISAMSRNVEKL